MVFRLEFTQILIIPVYYKYIIFTEIRCDLHFGLEYILPGLKMFYMTASYIGYYPYLGLYYAA